MDRKKIMVGVVGLGVVGALGGGVAAASTASGSAVSVPAASSVSSMPCWDGQNAMGRHGAEFGAGTAFEAAAKYLGVTEAQLRTRLQAGVSLADIARSEGKGVTGLKDAIVAAVRDRLQENTRLTTEQRAAMLERLHSRIDAMVTTKHRPGIGMGLRLGRADDTAGHGYGGGMGRMHR